MKTAIIKALSVVGLVPAGRYAVASRRADEMSSELQGWKKRTTKAEARATELEKRVAELKQRLDEHSQSLADRAREVVKMQKRLAQTEAALDAARKHLMTIEVKLEILEGAANVLDARTRAAIQARKTGAPV